MICKYCCTEYERETYKEFCSKTCTNKFSYNSTHINGYEVVEHIDYKIGENKHGFWILDKTYLQPIVAVFKTYCEAKNFIDQKIAISKE